MSKMSSTSKTLAVVGASYLQLPLVEKARELGYRVLCFAWEEGAVCKDICDRFYPVSTTEKEEITRICADEHINGICTIASDVAAPTVAYVAEQLGLPGNPYTAALTAHDKAKMRAAFSAAGLPCPLYYPVNADSDLSRLPFLPPMIVKPVDRSGSAGVQKVEHIEELKSAVATALERSFAHEAIVEQFIEGREISVEFISCGGKHYPLAITDKVTTGTPHFVELEHHQPAQFTQEEYLRIYALTSRALNALGITDGASHTEYKITDTGEPFLIETGARMGGDFIGSDLVRLSTGYDFLKGVIDVACGTFSEPCLPLSRHAGVYFLCKESERLLSIFQGRELLDGIVKKEQFGTQLKPVTQSADRIGYFIYCGNERLTV